jgi:hypothetical protein
MLREEDFKGSKARAMTPKDSQASNKSPRTMDLGVFFRVYHKAANDSQRWRPTGQVVSLKLFRVLK